MSPLMHGVLIVLGIVFLSTTYYVYKFTGTTPEGLKLPSLPPKIQIINNNNNYNPRDKNYMCNVAIAIYSQPAHAETRVKMAMDTWTKRICPQGTPQFMFIGIPETPNIPRAIDVPCKSDYFSLCCKSMEGLARLYEKYPNADWYYKVDDDTLLVPQNVDIMLAEHDHKDPVLLGYAIEAVVDKDTKKFSGQIREPIRHQENGQIYEDSIFYCSGSAYVMSSALVKNMMKNMSHYKEVWNPVCAMYDAEDVAVGLFAAKFGGRVEKIFGVFNKGWNWEDGPTDDTQEIVSVHLSRNTDKMSYFDRLLNGIIPRPKAKDKRFKAVFD